MERFPTELIVYGVLFLLILLFNYAARQVARQKQQQAPEPPEEEAAPGDEPYEVYQSPAEYWGRMPEPRAAVEPPFPVTGRTHAPPADRPRHPAAPRRASLHRSLVGSRKELRRAIVLMTVLGPCRGVESTRGPGP
jgi:hypothetical protein